MNRRNASSVWSNGFGSAARQLDLSLAGPLPVAERRPGLQTERGTRCSQVRGWREDGERGDACACLMQDDAGLPFLDLLCLFRCWLSDVHGDGVAVSSGAWTDGRTPRKDNLECRRLNGSSAIAIATATSTRTTRSPGKGGGEGKRNH